MSVVAVEYVIIRARAHAKAVRHKHVGRGRADKLEACHISELSRQAKVDPGGEPMLCRKRLTRSSRQGGQKMHLFSRGVSCVGLHSSRHPPVHAKVSSISRARPPLLLPSMSSWTRSSRVWQSPTTPCAISFICYPPYRFQSLMLARGIQPQHRIQKKT